VKQGVLLLLCTLSLLVTSAVAADEFGVHSRPWFGWWDANIVVAGPYLLRITPRPGGAAADAGLIAGDRLDLRNQSAAARIALTYQLPASQTTVLHVMRGATTRTVAVVGSTAWDNASFWKVQPMASRLLANLIFTACALFSIVSVNDRRARVMAVILVCLVGITLDPSFIVVPWPALSLFCLFASRACATTAAALLVWLSSKNRLAYSVIGAAFLVDLITIFGLATARVDPLPGILSASPWRSCLDLAMWAAVFAASRSTFVAPLSAGLFVSALCFALPAFVHTWVFNVAIIGLANVAVPAGAIASVLMLAAQSRNRASAPW
jgi:hypothetical protein